MIHYSSYIITSKEKLLAYIKTIYSFSQIFCWNKWILITTSDDFITYFYCIIVLQIVHSTYHYLNTKDPMVFIFLLTHVFKLLCYVYIINMIFVTKLKWTTFCLFYHVYNFTLFNLYTLGKNHKVSKFWES